MLSNDTNITVLKITYYKTVKMRKVKDSLLTINYIAIYVYNRPISSVGRSYELFNNMLGFMIVAPFSHIISRDFTSFGS
jgi:hypothetical protein